MCRRMPEGSRPALRGRFVAAAVNPSFVVDSPGDGTDAAPGNGVCRTAASTCTLRAAIVEANAQSGANEVDFAIPGSGVQTIQLGSQLPTVTDTSGPTTIDGYTQPGASPNSSQFASNAQLRIALRGTGSHGSRRAADHQPEQRRQRHLLL